LRLVDCVDLDERLTQKVEAKTSQRV